MWLFKGKQQLTRVHSAKTSKSKLLDGDVALETGATITKHLNLPLPHHFLPTYHASNTATMADKMDIDAVNLAKEEEKVGPAPELPPERSEPPT